MTAIFQPVTTFTDKSGDPLDNGSIYLGVTGFDARTNPKNHDGVLYFIDSSGQLCPKDLRTCGFVGHLQLAAST